MVKQELVIYAKHFNFTNDQGQLVEGGQIRVLTNVVDTTNDYGSKKGHKVATYKMPKEQIEKFIAKVPCLADVEYDFLIGDDGTTTVIPLSVTPVKEFGIFASAK